MALVDDLDRLADRVRGDDPLLRILPLAADGRYQLGSIALDALTAAVSRQISVTTRQTRYGGLPDLYCAWGKARVGSTALANLFGIAGLPSYYQPVKTILRHVLVDDDPPGWNLPARADHGAVFAKDVAGPYTLAECLYMPLQILVEAGYPADRIHLVMLDRDPAAALASWLRKFGHRLPADHLLAHYVLASLNAARVERYARAQGVPVTHYVHEASRDPVAAVRALFGRLGLAGRFAEAVVTDWSGCGGLDGAGSPLIRSDQPAAYRLPGIHGVETAYHHRDGATDAITDAHRALLDRHGLGQAYLASAAACRRELGLAAAALDPAA